MRHGSTTAVCEDTHQNDRGRLLDRSGRPGAGPGQRRVVSRFGLLVETVLDEKLGERLDKRMGAVKVMVASSGPPDPDLVAEFGVLDSARESVGQLSGVQPVFVRILHERHVEAAEGMLEEARDLLRITLPYFSPSVRGRAPSTRSFMSTPKPISLKR